MRKLATLVVVVAMLLSNFIFVSAEDPDGSLDLTFGENGIVATNLLGYYIVDSAIDPNGKIVVSGDKLTHSWLARYDSNGEIDTSFGINGVVQFDVNRLTDLASIDTLPTGDIIVGGTIVEPPVDRNFFLVKYQSNGYLDNSFGVNGIVETDLSSDDILSKVKIQNDGRIIAIGNKDDVSNLVIMRHNSNGSRDDTFGNNGVVEISIPSTEYAIPNDVQIQPDGKVLITGEFSSTTNSRLYGFTTRLNSNGSLDSTFGNNGMTMISIDNGDTTSKSLSISDEGKILIGGMTNTVPTPLSSFLARYNPDGSIDNTFGNSGIVRFNIAYLRLVELESLVDDSIVVLSKFIDSTEGDLVINKFNPDGSPTISFGNNGQVITSLSKQSESAESLSIQSDARIVVTSRANVMPYLVRYNNSYDLPEIDLRGGNAYDQSIPDGDTTPSNQDNTKFPNTNVCSGANQTVKRTFRIENTGSRDLNLLNNPYVTITGANASDFSVFSQPTSPIANGGGYSDFQIEFDPSVMGTRKATVNILNNDYDESLYDFAIQGDGEEQKMGVFVDIITNDAPVGYGQNIDFGDVPVGKSLKKVFTITNTGTGFAILNLTGNPPVKIDGQQGFFKVTAQPATTVLAPRQSITFEITFDAGQAGDITDSAKILNNTCSGAHPGELLFNLSGRGI